MEYKIQKVYNELKNQLFEDDEEDIWINLPILNENKNILIINAELDFSGDFEDINVPIPHSYSQKSFQFTVGDNNHLEVKADSFESLVRNILLLLKEKREQELEHLQTLETPVFEVCSKGESLSNDVDSDVDPEVDSDVNTDIEVEMDVDIANEYESTSSIKELMFQYTIPELQANINHMKANSKWDATIFPHTNSETCLIDIIFYFNPKDLNLPKFTTASWKLNMSEYLCLKVTIESPLFQQSNPMMLTTFQGGNIKEGPTSISKSMEKHKFGIEWLVNDRLTKWIQHLWPFVNIKHPFLKMVDYAMEILIHSAKYCLMCSKPLGYEGVIPSVCNNSLCIFSMESFSFGVDVEEYIKYEEELFELHITLASVAASSYSKSPRQFSPFPTGIISREVTRKGIIERSFMNFNNEPDVSLLGSIIDKIPRVAEMEAWICKGQLKERLDSRDSLIFPLIKWIISSNRTFLRPLKSHERILSLKTEFQYVMHNSTPEKEKIFNELKAKHGSLYVWHGSPLNCIFSILREGLKNMSGTKGQLHGAAYGKGIYLAENSSTSSSYMQYITGWRNSKRFHQDIGCLMLCEIINLYKANPYFVVPDNDHVQTRFFFILPQNNTYYHSISGSDFPKSFPKIEGFND